MGNPFKNIAIVGRHEDERVAEPMTALVGHLTKHGIRVYAADALALDLPVERIAEDELAARVDLFIAIGGDGTMLYAVSLLAEHDVPLLGVNRGRLGFLADVTPDEMLASVDHVLAGDYSRDSRLLLKTELMRGGADSVTGLALNDVVLQRRDTARMVDFETLVNGRYVNTHSGDGLIVATPTGSTAYALSCGGPIIEPQLDAVVLVPVAPHTLSDRPIVIPADEPIELRLLAREDTKAEIALDGRPLGEVAPGDRVLIGPASRRVNLVHPPGYDYYDILRSKLFWGQDSRDRGRSERRR